MSKPTVARRRALRVVPSTTKATKPNTLEAALEETQRLMVNIDDEWHRVMLVEPAYMTLLRRVVEMKVDHADIYKFMEPITLWIDSLVEELDSMRRQAITIGADLGEAIKRQEEAS